MSSGLKKWKIEGNLRSQQGGSHNFSLRAVFRQFQELNRFCPKSIGESNPCSKKRTVWSVNEGLSGNLQKPAAEVSGRFPVEKSKSLVIPDLLWHVLQLMYAENASDLVFFTETCRKPPQPVSGGFQRFLDNPSLTDLTLTVVADLGRFAPGWQ